MRTIGLAAALAAALTCLLSGQAVTQDRAVIAGRIYAAPEEPPVRDAVILIRDGLIRQVGPRDSTEIPAGYEVLDWSGFTVTAGFWNSHVHLTTPVYLRAEGASDAELEQELERTFTRWGFTTVFDLASTTEIANAVGDRIEAGQVRGPRVLSVAEPFYPEDATPIYARPFYEAFGLPSAEVSTPDQAVDRVGRQVRDGAAGIKIFAGSIVGGEAEVVVMPGAIIAAVSDEAARLGRPVFAHPTNRAGLEAAVGNGATVLAHAAPLMGPWPDDYAQWLATRQVALIPTLSLFELEPHPSTPVSVAVQQTAALHEAGGVILFGTDAGFTDAFDTSDELRLLESAIGWRGVLTSLTTAPAELYGEGAVRGRIAPGYAADLVAVAGDPAEEIISLARVGTVMVAGKVIFQTPDL